jgi:hypothetical protein
MVVTQRAAGANFSVDIAAGRCAIAGTDVPRQGKYLVQANATINIGTPPAPTTGITRIHRLVAEALDKQASGTLYGWQYHLVEDTGSGLPATPGDAYTLATIAIPVGAASVTNAMITNMPRATGFAKYTAAITATGENQPLTAGGTSAVQLINARTVCPDVTASGTNNVTFTLNKAGPWAFYVGLRIKPGTTGNHFGQLVRNDTGELIGTWFPGSITAGNIYDASIVGADYFATPGITITLTVVTGTAVSGSLIDSGTVTTGLRTFLAMQWQGSRT